MPYKDPDKRRESNLRSVKKYQNSKEGFKESKRSYTTMREREHRAFLRNYKTERGCVKCGNRHPAVLHFHHVDPSNKKFTISNNLQRSLTQLMKEVDKCIVICANCHLILHYDEKREE